MKPILDSLRALKTSFAGVLRPTATVEFPKVIRPRGERYRASFALPEDENGELACVACQACEKVCPSNVIKVAPSGKRESPATGKKRQYPDGFTLDLSACIQCELCVQVCNSDAIVMVREPEEPVFRREDLVLDLGRLRANARERTASWGRGSVLQELQDPKPRTDAKPKPKPEVKPEVKPEAKPAEAAPPPAPEGGA